MLAYLKTLYQNREQFEARKDSVRKEVRRILGIDRYMDSLVHKKPILGKVRRYDGYTVQNICIETLPGEHVYINYLCILCFQIPAYFYNLLSIYKNIFSDRHIPRYYCTILQ